MRVWFLGSGPFGARCLERLSALKGSNPIINQVYRAHIALARFDERAADRIMENMSKSPIVLLSGPSGSGKTTTAMKICEVLESRGIRTHGVSLDN